MTAIPLPTPAVLLARFWAKVDKTTTPDCWLWTGWTDRGKGKWRPNGDPREKPVHAHRYAYELLIGPIPDGGQLSPTCGRTHCVNPDHREFTTPAERAHKTHPHCAAVSTHCKRNHLWAENLDINDDGYTRCYQCYRDSIRAAYQRNRPATDATSAP